MFPPLNNEEIAAFEKLKKLLTSDLVLNLPKHGLKYVIDKDACKKQVGWVLIQEHTDEQDKIVRQPVG